MRARVHQWCTNASHNEVLTLIRQAGKRVALGVVSDSKVKRHSLHATQQLLQDRNEIVIHPLTGAPVFTLEMMVGLPLFAS